MKRLLSPQDKIVDALQENRVLSGLDNEILELLADNTQLISFEAEETVIREGQLSDPEWLSRESLTGESW